MDEKVQRILNVYASLTEKQKKELREELEKRNTWREIGGLQKRYPLNEDHTVVMGPLSGKCAYCGR